MWTRLTSIFAKAELGKTIGIRLKYVNTRCVRRFVKYLTIFWLLSSVTQQKRSHTRSLPTILVVTEFRKEFRRESIYLPLEDKMVETFYNHRILIRIHWAGCAINDWNDNFLSQFFFIILTYLHKFLERILSSTELDKHLVECLRLNDSHILGLTNVRIWPV